jgi:hypothetical protein
VATHQQAHQDLLRLQEPIPENKKVRDFLQGITDPQCAPIKLNVLSNKVYMNNFLETVNYMASAIDMLQKSTTPNFRQVSQVQTNIGGGGRTINTNRNSNARSTYRGGSRMNYRGRGRGFRGRGGRFIPSNASLATSNTTLASNNRGGYTSSIARGYPYADWQNLSTNQRQQVYQERERLNRSIAAINISSSTSTTQDNNDPASIHAGQIRGVEQASLDNISQVMSRRRTTGAYYTTKHMTSHIAALKQIQQSVTCRAELDTHADTCRVNNMARILSYTGKVAHVSAFSPQLDVMTDIPIVKAAVAYDDATTGETYILIINQALYFGNLLPHILLNPNQLRANGIIVNDIPKHLSHGTSSHSIDFTTEGIKLPLLLKGIISYLPVRMPTQEEVDQGITLEITAENVEWEPYSCGMGTIFKRI